MPGRSDALSATRTWQVGITDHVVAPADLEAEAFPEAEFHFLEDWRTGEGAAALWRQMDAILVWHWAVDAYEPAAVH